MSDNLGKKLIASRRKTIKKLDDLANDIDKIHRNSKIALLSGTSASILGVAVSVPIGIAAIVLTGGAAAIPLGIAAGVIGGMAGGAGGATQFGATLGGHFHVKSKYEKAVAAVEEDMAFGEQFVDDFKIARGAMATAKIGIVGVEVGAKIAPKFMAAATAEALEAAAKVGKVAGAVGIVFSLVLLPVDIYVLVKNSKEIHNEEKHDKAEKIREWVKEMKNTLPELERLVAALGKIQSEI